MPYKDTTEKNGEGIIMKDDPTELALQAKDSCVGSRLMHSTLRILSLLDKRHIKRAFNSDYAYYCDKPRQTFIKQ